MDDAGALSKDDGLAHPVQSRRVFLSSGSKVAEKSSLVSLGKIGWPRATKAVGCGIPFPCPPVETLDEILFASHPFQVGMVGDSDLDPLDVGWVDVRSYSHGEVGGVHADSFLGWPVVRASADPDEGELNT